MSLSRGVLEALLPPGSLWVPEDDRDFDQLLTGMANNTDAVYGVLKSLAYLRDPQLTTLLEDLEKEYGVITQTGLSETVRRDRLSAIKSSRSACGSVDCLQDKLQAAGFDVQVHVNNPAVDPGLFLDFAATSIMGNAGAQFGAVGVQFGGPRGELIVNGKLSTVSYTTPADPVYWPLVFFVGGDATRNGGGSLTAIDQAAVDILRREELRNLIVKYKPMYSWCGLVARYVSGG